MITDGNDINIASYRLAKTARGNTPKTDPKAIQTKRDIEILKNEEKIPILINTLDEIDTLIYSIQDYIQEYPQFDLSSGLRRSRLRLIGGVLDDTVIEELKKRLKERDRDDSDSEATTENDEESEIDDEDLYESVSEDYTYEGPSSIEIDDEGAPSEGTPSEGTPSERIIENSPPGTNYNNILKLQEKVNRLSLLTRGLNKIINFSSPQTVEELKEINKRVRIAVEDFIVGSLDSTLAEIINKILLKLIKENEKIKSAVNSYTGNFLGGAVFNSSGMGNTMGEIYRQSPRKRFF